MVHGRRSVGDGGGTRPPIFRVGDSIGFVPPLFSSKKFNNKVSLNSKNNITQKRKSTILYCTFTFLCYIIL